MYHVLRRGIPQTTAWDAVEPHDVPRGRPQEPMGARGNYLFFFFFFPHPIYYLRPSVLSLLVVTQIRGHIAGFSPPLPTTVTRISLGRRLVNLLPVAQRTNAQTNSTVVVSSKLTSTMKTLFLKEK